ncbi:Transglycosylase SLT domain-containing protein [Brevinema andersonii]|uniref:Transglycosylase SLT domain-containing protein n=1 Tax=Brevinema andersonii TaxID=34097 RepID=A0A1I1D668_BREAD|nr:lytic transglycosylase domain-containing protein [Brevinema andersonii]SFB69846.1 Transglycosylase SLT domain-containing protein [Brevinema andersonii]
MNLFCKILWMFLLLGSCNSFGAEPVGSVKDAYRKGQYRQVVRELGRMESLTPEDTYILAQSYSALKMFDQALKYFSQIDYKTFAAARETAFLYPFFVQDYLNVLTSNPRPLDVQEKLNIFDIAALVPSEHLLRSDIDRVLFRALWNEGNFIAMMLVDKNLSAQGRAWREIAKFHLGQAYDLGALVEGWDGFSQPQAYGNILQTIDPGNISDPKQAKVFAEAALKTKSQRKRALEFASRYRELSGDQEFLLLTEAEVARLEGERDRAALILYSFVMKNDASLSFHQAAHRQLVRQKMYPKAYRAARVAYQRYGIEFSTEYTDALEQNKKPDLILKWYKQNYQNISQDLHNQILRALIRSDIKRAEQAADLGAETNSDHGAFLFMRGLIKEHLGKTQEAYKVYLDVMFKEPFGYAGLVSRQKELAMRSKFRPIFEEKISNTVSILENLGLENRLLISKALLIDPETMPLIDRKQLQKDQVLSDKQMLKALNVKSLPYLEKFDKRLTNFSHQSLKYLEAAVAEGGKDSDDPHITAKYFYKYLQLFEDADILGYVMFRMYFYVRAVLGASYLPVFPKEMVELLYPKPEYAYIKELSGNNTDISLWMLSSFHAESHFRKFVSSGVGAVGFAQVMPYTAVDIRRWLKNPDLNLYDVFDNIEMGVFYHNKMFKEYKNNHIFALAAYNAGPGRIKHWRKEYAKIAKDPYLFVEAIPFRETRNYVKIITYNHAFYQLLDEKGDILW